MAVDFTPEMKEYSGQGKFRYWVQMVLPTIYDDSLSYMELLNKVVYVINLAIDDVGAVEDNVSSLLTAFENLQQYTNDYFDNLDVQEAINKKLDVMANDGTLSTIIEPLLSEYANQVQLLNNRINVLSARMDTFSQLTEGSTTGDAELQDIRVGYDGTIYPTAGDSVRTQVSNLWYGVDRISDLLYSRSNYVPVTNEANGVYLYSTGQIVNTNTGRLKKVMVDPDILAYFVTTTWYGNNSMYVGIAYFDEDGNQLGYQYPAVPNEDNAINRQLIIVPPNTSYFYVNSRVRTGVPTPEIKGVTQDSLDVIRNLEIFNDLMGEYVVEDELTTRRIYGSELQEFIVTDQGTVKKYNVVNDVDYYISSQMLAQNAGFPLVIYFNADDEIIGTAYDNTPNVEVKVRHTKINIPSDCTYFYLNGRYGSSEVRIWKKDLTNTLLDKYVKKEISILFIGNSMTQDAVSYVPYVLNHVYPDLINFKFYIWYTGGYTLQQQWGKISTQTPAGVFSIAENNSYWYHRNNSVNLDYVLNNYTFDIVCLQEYFNYKESYTEADLVYWNNIQNYIADNYAGDNPLKFITFFHAPLRARATEVFNITKDGVQLILDNTIAEDVLTPGIAVYNALSTDLNDLGDAGGLSPDGTHTQEGLPCLLQSWNVILWIFNQLAIPKSVYGSNLIITTDIFEKIVVPGANLGTGVIEGTVAQNREAQEIAIQSYKEGLKIFDI